MYKTPGVYTQEVNSLPSSVAALSTAVPAFIGYTGNAGKERELDGIATRINTLFEYQDLYGMAQDQAFEITVEDGLAKSAVIDLDKASPYLMHYQLQMYFLNGGGPCFIIPVGPYKQEPGAPKVVLADMDETTDVATGRISGLAVARKVDEITLLVFPDAPALNGNDYYFLYQAAIKQCSELKDRFTIIDIKEPVLEGTDGTTAIDEFRSGIGNNYLNYAAAYYPCLSTSLSYQYDTKTFSVNSLTFKDQNGIEIAEEDISNPLFRASLKKLIAGFPLVLPPSGALAGVYAQVDRTRGVFKAPANVSLNSVIAPTVKITDEEQENLNVHSSGKSINAIRSFVGKGVLVWGARTLEGNSNEWRYIAVRRFFLFVEESLQKAIEPFVFESNNENTWLRIKGLIDNFLTGQWRAGALFGSTPEQAYFVNLGLGSTMTSEDVLNGRLIVEIGMATVRPAEFIILRFSQNVQDA